MLADGVTAVLGVALPAPAAAVRGAGALPATRAPGRATLGTRGIVTGRCAVVGVAGGVEIAGLPVCNAGAPADAPDGAEVAATDGTAGCGADACCPRSTVATGESAINTAINTAIPVTTRTSFTREPRRREPCSARPGNLQWERRRESV